MRAALCVVLGLAFAVTSLSKAADKDDKEVTLKGTITCAKCDLKVEKSCAVVIVVKEDGKDVLYYFDPKGMAAHHKKGLNVCTNPTKGSVTGVVSEKDGKKIITVKKATADKDK